LHLREAMVYLGLRGGQTGKDRLARLVPWPQSHSSNAVIRATLFSRLCRVLFNPPQRTACLNLREKIERALRKDDKEDLSKFVQSCCRHIVLEARLDSHCLTNYHCLTNNGPAKSPTNQPTCQPADLLQGDNWRPNYQKASSLKP